MYSQRACIMPHSCMRYICIITKSCVTASACVCVCLCVCLQFVSRSLDDMNSEEWLMALGLAMGEKDLVVERYTHYPEEKVGGGGGSYMYMYMYMYSISFILS